VYNTLPDHPPSVRPLINVFFTTTTFTTQAGHA